jgi:uncharacterized protein (DUF433 family)
MTSHVLDWGVRAPSRQWGKMAKAQGAGAGARRSEAMYNIVRDSGIWAGLAVVAGTRLPVFMIIDLFHEVGSVHAVIDHYPSLKPADVYSALGYASAFDGRVKEDRARHEAAFRDVLGG